MTVKRVARSRRIAGRKVPTRGRRWWHDGSWVRLRLEVRTHVWADDVLPDRTPDGRAFRLLTVLAAFPPGGTGDRGGPAADRR